MYDVSFKSEGCVADPSYNANMCGFNNFPGCIPLNGCGKTSIFVFLIIFVCVMSFIFMNIFVGVLLTEYGTLSDIPFKDDHFRVFTEHWMLFDPTATLNRSWRFRWFPSPATGLRRQTTLETPVRKKGREPKGV
jgi:hypothetical protein